MVNECTESELLETRRMTDSQMEVLSEQRPDGNMKLRVYYWKEAHV